MTDHTGTLVPFTSDEFALDLIPSGDTFKVAAPGLARALGFAEAAIMTRNMPDAEKGSVLVQTPGGEQRVLAVTEAGFYRAIGQRQAARITDPAVRSKVERFQSWVYGTVLPEIRRTGSYSPAPALPVDRTELLARAVLEATAALEEKEAHIRELAPRAAVADELMDATGLLSLQELAKALGWGPNILFRDLRRLGVLQSNRLPYQRYAHHFEVKLGTYKHPKTGETMPTHRPYARPSAIPFLRRKLAGLEQSLDLEVAS